jgi:hypothetical protein
MQNRKLLGPLVISMLPLSFAHADPTLIAVGSIDGSYEDFAVETRAPLENGVPGNRLGGIGSGLAYAGSNTFLALPDRGPNATPFNSAIDDTTSYIPRFHTLHLSLAHSESANSATANSAAGATLPFTLTPFVTNTTLLSSPTPLVYGTGDGLGVGNGAPSLNTRRTNYFSGRSDNFDPRRLSSNPNNGRLDPESIRLSNDGNTIFISDEYGPFVYQFDRSSGKRIRAYRLPDKFGVIVQSPKGDVEISGNTQGRIANKGMEGLAISPDGRTLYGAMQSPLEQDGGTDAAYTRIVRIDVRTGFVKEIAYPLTNIGTASKPKYGTVSDIVAINDHELLVDERDGKGLGDGSNAAVKLAYQIDVSNAADVGAIAGAVNLAGKAVAKTLFLDVVAALNGAGIASDNIPAKLEGFAFGPDVEIDGTMKHTLFIANDNDYSSNVGGKPNPNQFFVFAFDDADFGAASAGFQPQQFSDRGCDDDAWPTFDHDSCDDRR